MDRQKAMDWADRLESGEYPQGRSALNEFGKFCCLGVLSEMAVEAGIAVKEQLSDSDTIFRYVDVEPSDSECPCCVPGTDSRTGILTRNIQAWAGMQTAQGAFPDDISLKGFDALTVANDASVSFLDIAKFIRENYEIL